MKILQFLKCFYTAPAMPKRVEHKQFRRLLLFCGWAILALLPVYCLLMTEYIHYADKARFVTFFLERTQVVLFDLGLFYLLWLCVLCLCKKGWIATLVFGGAVSAVSFVNYLKHAMTGDYFYPWDFLQQAGNLGELTQFITVPFPILYTIMIALIGVMAVIVYFSGAVLPLTWFVRYPAAVVMALCMFLTVSTPEKVSAYLNQHGLNLEDMALQTSNYAENGFVGAFTINILSSNIQKPEDYSAARVAELMEDCEEQPASDRFSAPDIILILSESFWDPTMLPGTTFSEDPIDNYRSIIEEEGVISGRFFTTGFGGGTVRPEFEVLTGLTTDYLPSGCVPWQYITGETDSYASVYKALGYNTVAVHPYKSTFYNRKTAFPLIGIDTLHFEDDIYALKDEIGVYVDGKQISDYTFVESIQYYLDQYGDAPVFLYGISMENHQPYPNKYDTHPITAANEAFDENTANAVLNFTKGVSHADNALSTLVDYIKNRDRDTILIYFGDHLPTLGAGFGAYVQSGMIGAYDEADYERMYSTPFLIYANFELQESTMLHAGKDNSIASYNLMNAAAQLIGAPRTAYMKYLEQYYSKTPYYNVRLHKSLSDEAAYYANGHKVLTYDILAGSQYLYQE